MRILGSDNILTKVFVSEALTCDDPIEANLYDILESGGLPLPCFYCRKFEQRDMFSVMSADSFPLCKACHKLGRGEGAKRKSRVIKPKPMKLRKFARRRLNLAEDLS